MSIDLILKTSCSRCGSTAELYGSTCKHLTLCMTCGKTMAENHTECCVCGTPITILIREYNVQACSSSNKNYFLGRFAAELPNFKKKNEKKWSLQKGGLQGLQVTDALQEKYKNKSWLLEDETDQFQYHAWLQGSQLAPYYLLMHQGRQFVTIPAGSRYHFKKVTQYRQLTLEEAEEKMKNRRKTADGYHTWLMNAAKNGPAAFGEVEKFDDRGVEEAARKRRLRLNKKGGNDEEDPREGDLDFEHDNVEKGNDWEYEEFFSDDEAVGNDPEEREDLEPEIAAPLEIKQDDKVEGEADEEKVGLSRSGKEFEKLLGQAYGRNDLDAEDNNDNDDEVKAAKDETASAAKSSAPPTGASPPAA